MSEGKGLFAAVMAVAAINGILSPATPILVLFAPVWYPELLPLTQGAVFYVASMLVASLTAMIGGVPAALWERAFAASELARSGSLIWLICVIFLSLPGLLRLLP